MSKIIDGKMVSLKLKDELKEKVSKLDVKPKLVVISVGDNPASKVYVRQKEKCATYVGFEYEHKHYDEIKDEDLIKEIEKLNKDKKVSGMIVQLPLPKGMDEKRIVNTIDPDKDVDGLSYINAGRLLNNEECLASCTPAGIMELLKAYNIDPCGKRVVVIGRSILVGKPNFVKKNMVKRGAIVIDVGINRVDDKLVGDVDYNDVYSKVKLITPVPGGVGPMTVIMLMKNVYKAYLKTRK